MQHYLCLEHFLPCFLPCFSAHISLSIPPFGNYLRSPAPASSLPPWPPFQAPQSIQLPQKQAPSWWELERGTEEDGPTPRALNPFAERSQEEFRELEVGEQADVCSERAARGGGPPAPSCLQGLTGP